MSKLEKKTFSMGKSAEKINATKMGVTSESTRTKKKKNVGVNFV
jgi:hypothetical protein